MNSTPLAEPPGKWLAFLSLFTSTGTLLCCALPALLVALGSGAALSSLVAVVPGLVWVSEYKVQRYAPFWVAHLIERMWRVLPRPESLLEH